MTRNNSTTSCNRQFELQTGKHFEGLGYKADVTRGTGDFGVDVFIEKDGLRYAVQVKNYGACRTRISRKDVMELYGAMAYFGCDGAKFVYNGAMSPTAQEVADKLGIECIRLEFDNSQACSPAADADDFEQIWSSHIRSLVGKTISSVSKTAQYHIEDVTDSVIRFTNRSGKAFSIRKDILKWTYESALIRGEVRGKDIRDEFHTIFSSFVVAVFATLPQFSVLKGPRIVPAPEQG